MVPSTQTWACRGLQSVWLTRGVRTAGLLWPQAAVLSAVDRQLRRPHLPPSRLSRLCGPHQVPCPLLGFPRSWFRGWEGGWGQMEDGE